MFKLKKVFKILGSIILVLVTIFLCYIYFPWVILPVQSRHKTITLVECGGPYIRKVSISHYINDIHENDYTLDTELRIQQPQYYRLPKLNVGKATINIELEDGMNGEYITFPLNYEDASDMYKKGILIYSTANYKSSITIDGFVYNDQYVYIISGKEKACHFKKAGLSEWKQINDFSMLKVFAKEQMGYTPLYDEWKQNKWIISKGER